jgi:hypothetical protein
MKTIQETFLETDWGDEETARQARNDRAEQLEAQGLLCTCENLYNVLGYRVFLLEAREAEPIDTRRANPDSTNNRERERPNPRPKPGSRPRLDYEER